MSRLAAKVKDVEDGAAVTQALAAMDLVLDDGRGKSLDRSISSLRELADTVKRPAPVLADLAAALIVRAERTQAPRDLLEAHETADLALRSDPQNLAALYNRALALDRFGLVDEAARDWDTYLKADSSSGWADEARRRRRALAALAPALRPAADAPLDAYARYAAAEPQGARELGMNRLLGEWAEAVDAGNAARAGDRLRRAGVLGEALERRPGGDNSLADAVRAIRAASGSAGATRGLARAHREYAAGMAHFEAGRASQAEPLFIAAEAAALESPAMLGWARVHLGISRLQNGARDDGERILREAASSAAAARCPAMAARARWPLAVVLSRAERYEAGLAEARESARLFARAGERENEGAALGIVADAFFVLGESDSGYVAARRALDRLKPYRTSVRLHNQLIAIARAADGDGLLRSAIRLQDEGVAVAAHSGRPSLRAEAHTARAVLLAAAGDSRGAARDVAAARPLLRALESAYGLGWLTADLHEAEAAVLIRRDPRRAMQAFDSAATYFGGIRLPFRMLRALANGAEARLAMGDQAGAAERLETAVRFLDQRRDSIRIEARRAAVFDAARRVVDRMVMLKLAAGRVSEALDYMDRGRASLASVGPTAAIGVDGGVRAPPGEVAVEYARVADTLLVWTVAGSRAEVFRTLVDTVRLARILSDLEDRLEDGAGEAAVRPMLSELYRQLVKPIETRLGGPGTPLVVIADGEIASVPFAALHDARRERYLVQDHPLRFAVSLREARRRPAASPAGSPVFVADPAFDPREHPLLDRLEHARDEVRSISAEYPGRSVLEGSAATRPALDSALTRAGMVHFAGHAVFDDARPERSYLLLAADSGRAGSGKVTAGELARLDLRHVRLVVLAACRTVRAGRSRAGGFTGLSGALLAAGAGGAVGSTWDVDDRSTAALMAGFHRAYRGSRDGPRALQAAQLELLRSGDATLRTPAAWAGFRYAGR